MTNSLKVKKINSKSNLYIDKTSKFKSIYMEISYKFQYDYKLLTAFAILAKYMGNCSLKYPSIEQFNKKIESLYGSNLGIKFNKKGDLLSFNVFVYSINGKYVKDDSLLDEILAFMHQMIYEPLIVNKELDKQLFDICKNATLQQFNAKKEKNGRYAVSLLKETISQDKTSSFALSLIGDEATCKKLNNKNIIKYYKQILKASFDVYVSGNVNTSETTKLVKKYFKKPNLKKVEASPIKPISDITYQPIIINQGLAQSTVAIAYQMPIYFNQEDYYAVRYLNYILCGTLGSKFYRVIREQLGLCYSISANYYSHDGVFTIITGVSGENVNKAVSEVENQINEVKNGNISEEEFNSARETILSNFSSILDSISGFCDMNKVYSNFGVNFDFDREYKKYNEVTKQDIIRVSKKMKYLTYVAIV